MPSVGAYNAIHPTRVTGIVDMKQGSTRVQLFIVHTCHLSNSLPHQPLMPHLYCSVCKPLYKERVLFSKGSGFETQGLAREGDLSAFFAHDTNANICSLDHGHIISTISNSQHLARKAPMLPVQPLLQSLRTSLSLCHLHNTRSVMLCHHKLDHTA